jgi:hypothetical protein
VVVKSTVQIAVQLRFNAFQGSSGKIWNLVRPMDGSELV